MNAVKPAAHRGAPDTIATLDDAIYHLAETLLQLADYVREHEDELTVNDLARLCAVRGQNLTRMAQLLREKAIQAGEVDGELEAQIDEALGLAGDALDVEV